MLKRTDFFPTNDNLYKASREEGQKAMYINLMLLFKLRLVLRINFAVRFPRVSQQMVENETL